MADAVINDLPDSAFAYIEPGGTKDSEGKTTPRSLRHFPIHDAAHVRNALARLSSSPFEAKARPAVEAAAKKMGIGEPAGRSQSEGGPMADVLIRAFASEIGSLDRLDEGILECRYVPFNTPVQVTDILSDGSLDTYVEEIAPTMFAQQVRGHPSTVRRIEFFDGHPHSGMARTKLGWTSGLRAADDGLYGTIAVRPNARADVKAMIADGIKELSIGFQPAAGGTMTRADGSRLRVKGALDHIALEPQGAYPGAEVLAMRAQALAKEDEAFVAEAERADRVDLEAWLKEAEETQLMYARRAHGITG